MRTRKSIEATLSLMLAAASVGVPTACAQPPSFPDLSLFTEIDQNSPIIATGRIGNIARFATPDGLRCNASTGLQECRSYGLGVIPAFPPTAVHLTSSSACPSERVASSDTSSSFSYTQDCDSTTSLPILSPGQKVTMGKAVCVVGDNRLTACTNGTHGFVIQPSGSWTF